MLEGTDLGCSKVVTNKFNSHIVGRIAVECRGNVDEDTSSGLADSLVDDGVKPVEESNWVEFDILHPVAAEEFDGLGMS